jgi:hypothetical protein
MAECIISDGLERMWKEAVLAYFKVLSWHSTEGIEENHKKSQDIRCPGRYLNQAPPEYK